MTKIYKSPALEIVSVNNNIITESLNMREDKTVNDVKDILAPGRNFDSWYEGY